MNFGKNRVLLLYPAAEAEQVSLIPLSLLYVAQPLIEDTFDVEIIDQRFENDFFASIRQRIGPDLICIGISCITGPQILQVLRISEFIRKMTDTPIVLGGPHATLLPHQTLESEIIDYVVIGKGEAPFLNLVRALKMNESIEGISRVGYKANGRIFINMGSVPDINVRRIPYFLISRYGRFSTVPIVSSYGCRYNCSFCVERVLHPEYYEIPILDVLFMVEDALRLRPRFINFIDDNFLLNQARVMEIFSLFRQNGLNFRWICTGRIDEVISLGDDALRFLKERGLFSIYFGIESGSLRILKLIRKGITPEMVLKINSRLKKEGIIPHYSFMAGFPTETKEDIEKTVKFMYQLKQENPQAVIWKINTYTPYPGTDLFDLAVKNGFKPPETLGEWSRVHFYSKEYTAPHDVYL
ncbi:MAG: B12-binding domain-containing radical SAM protein [Deltaproteobacteria bacterium]|nr:B12-binding domain-containing radical SAM protein [Deltaproteobacteria bacterium]